MAEGGYDGFSYASWPIASPAIPQPHAREALTPLPSFSSYYNNWSNYEQPAYPLPHTQTPPRPPDANFQSHHFHTSFSPAFYGGLPTPEYQGLPAAMPHQTLPSMRSMTRHFDTRMQETFDVDPARHQPVNHHAQLDTSMQQAPMPHNAMPRVSLPQLHHTWSQSSYDAYRPSGQSTPSSIAPSSRPRDTNGEATMRPANATVGSSVRTGPVDVEPAHRAGPTIAGIMNQPSERPNNQASETSEWRPLDTPYPESLRSPRLERNTSSRSSHRRSFDRYSTDLSHSSNTPGSDDAVRSSTHRSRRPRTMLGDRAGSSGLQARLLAHYHPNVPSPIQLQNLKKRLKKRVRTGLAKDVSPTCDICQKDYSEKLVEPTEEEEIAVILPCKHVFGEHCISTWFETCRTQKNKITCPMCRTLLVDPARRREEILEMIAGQGYAGLERFVQDESRWMIAERGLEGDFANA